MSRIVDGFFWTLKAISGALLAAMIALVFLNVVLRYAFNSGITVSEELARWFFVWLTFIGAVVALRERQHLGMDTLVRMMGRTGRKACLVLSHALMLYATGLLLWGSWKQMLINWDMTAPATELSTAWFYGAGVFFGVFGGLVLLWDLVLLVTNRLSDDELISVRESEDEPHPVGPTAEGR
jgi:TRAP-type C4-dicarboxylate transport system permease small subunit